MLLWTKHLVDGWTAHDVGAGVFITRDAKTGHRIGSERSGEALAAIVPFVAERSPGAALIPAHGTRASVEGFPALSFHPLSDRAEIMVAGVRMRFGAYSAPKVWRYGGDEREQSCACYKLQFERDDPVTECGRCQRLFHVSKERFAAWLASRDAANATDSAGTHDHGEVDCDLLSKVCTGCDALRSRLLWSPDEEHEEVRDA